MIARPKCGGVGDKRRAASAAVESDDPNDEEALEEEDAFECEDELPVGVPSSEPGLST